MRERDNEMMLYYGRPVPVATVEARSQELLKGYDDLPPLTRAAVDETAENPDRAAILVARFGDAGAAKRILTTHSSRVFRPRPPIGANR